MKKVLKDNNNIKFIKLTKDNIDKLRIKSYKFLIK